MSPLEYIKRIIIGWSDYWGKPHLHWTRMRDLNEKVERTLCRKYRTCHYENKIHRNSTVMQGSFRHS